MCHNRAMRAHLSTLVLAIVALVLGVIAYLKDPGASSHRRAQRHLDARTPGGPMVSVPFMVVQANSGVATAPLVAYMTAWSLFGLQRIIAWEAPLMGWRFVAVRVIPSLAFPVLAGWLVKVFYQE
jgi:hypothetical protein